LRVGNIKSAVGRVSSERNMNGWKQNGLKLIVNRKWHGSSSWLLKVTGKNWRNCWLSLKISKAIKLSW